MTTETIIPNFLQVKDKQKYNEYDTVQYFIVFYHMPKWLDVRAI